MRCKAAHVRVARLSALLFAGRQASPGSAAKGGAAPTAPDEGRPLTQTLAMWSTRRSKLFWPFVLACSLAAAASAQRVACVGEAFTAPRRYDPRQSCAAALGWRLPSHEVRAFAKFDAALVAWRPELLVVTESDCKAGAALAHTLRALAGAGVATRAFLAAVRSSADDPLGDARALAAELNATLVDLRSVGHGFADDGALDPFGADAVARVLAQSITGRTPQLTTTPVPSPEHRASATGWGDGCWWDQHEQIRALAAANRDLDLVFVGDEFTQSLTGTGNRLTAPDGGRAIDQVFGHVKAAGFGIAGDHTQHLLFRLRRGEFAPLRPRAIVLQIGLHNVLAGDSAEAVVAGIVAILAELRAQQPQAHVLVCGPLPHGAEPQAPSRHTVAAIHARLRARDERVAHLDLSARFVAADGKLDDRLTRDGFQLTEAGREAWLAAVAEALRDVLR